MAAFAHQALADDGDIAPAPPSIGAAVPLTYFGPAPSQVMPELIGPLQLLRAGEIDHNTGTVTLPLYEGFMESGESVWYIVTDTSDADNAAALGLNHSAKLTYANVGRAVRQARIENRDQRAVLVFESGTVDFSPEHKVVPGDAPAYFPPKDVQPGSVGDDNYSPLAVVENAGNAIYNAPMVAFGATADQLEAYCEGEADHSVVHDKVVHICPSEGTVTIALTAGFSFAKPVLYLSTDASDPLPAALEGATFAPGLADIPVGGDDSLFSSVERIFVSVNGPTGMDNPHRQGLTSALAGEGSPLNTLGGIPTVATDYSPLWDLNPYVWTDAAIEAGYRSRLTEEFDILGKVEQGFLTGLGGGAFGSIGFVVNCPIVFRFL
ncbi:hypothetical protein [Loktanella sp. IMCC34160]|uniref:hypothetical protein n=1 Tax=Loktanella sp. IMCC34160 TaxID=2510646 RepID=UPI001A91713E|nr:hypothetical protein [Loktanella sp. IMCC34160]